MLRIDDEFTIGSDVEISGRVVVEKEGLDSRLGAMCLHGVEHTGCMYLVINNYNALIIIIVMISYAVLYMDTFNLSIILYVNTPSHISMPHDHVYNYNASRWLFAHWFQQKCGVQIQLHLEFSRVYYFTVSNELCKFIASQMHS